MNKLNAILNLILGTTTVFISFVALILQACYESRLYSIGFALEFVKHKLEAADWVKLSDVIAESKKLWNTPND
jgi:hypothetical protein